MTTPDPRPAEVRDAIAVMTAWISEETDDNFVTETTIQMLDEQSVFEPNIGLVRLIGGLTGLCGFMLAGRERETGISMQDTLREYGRHFAEE